jgi:protein TonB
MERRLFEDLVVSRGPGRRAGAVGMPVSMVVHAAGVTGLLALSLVVPEELPVAPAPEVGDVVFVPAPRPPAPERPVAPAARNPRPDRRTESPVFEVPVEAQPLEVEAFNPDDDLGHGCVGCAPLDDTGGGGGGDGRGAPDGMGGPGTADPISAPIRVGGHIQAPRKIRHVAPGYPDLARRAGVAGVVILECVIDRDGVVESVRVLSGHPLLNEAAAGAVRQWQYRPTLLNSVPVAVVMTVTVRFTTR